MYLFSMDDPYPIGFRDVTRCCETCQWYTYDAAYGDSSCSSPDSIQCGDWPAPDYCCEYWEEANV